MQGPKLVQGLELKCASSIQDSIRHHSSNNGISNASMIGMIAIIVKKVGWNFGTPAKPQTLNHK